MKHLFFGITSLIFLLISCQSTDEKFCSCMNKSQEVNRLSQKIWDQHGTKNDSLMFKKMIRAKEKLCAEYAHKNGDELLQLKNDCD